MYFAYFQLVRSLPGCLCGANKYTHQTILCKPSDNVAYYICTLVSIGTWKTTKLSDSTRENSEHTKDSMNLRSQSDRIFSSLPKPNSPATFFFLTNLLELKFRSVGIGSVYRTSSKIPNRNIFRFSGGFERVSKLKFDGKPSNTMFYCWGALVNFDITRQFSIIPKHIWIIAFVSNQMQIKSSFIRNHYKSIAAAFSTKRKMYSSALKCELFSLESVK